MSYKTILVHLDEKQHAQERVTIAANLALAQEAHLIGAAMTGVSRYIYQDTGIDENDPHLKAQLEKRREETSKTSEFFEPLVKSIGITAFETRIVDDEAGGGICLQARYSDLVIVGQTDPEKNTSVVMPDFPEYVILNSGRPVLVVPYEGKFPKVGKRILISWDAGRDATRAVTDAIPFLKLADIVQVVVFNSASSAEIHGEQPGADIALYLARHNIKVEVSQQKTKTDIGNALLSLATDFNADLIVMGGYGHSRFREMILGGVTRTILESMTVPVMMSH